MSADDLAGHEDLAKLLYVTRNWHRRITEHDRDRRPDDEYKARAAKYWDEGHAGWAMYAKYRELAAVIAAAGWKRVDDKDA